MSSSAGRDPQLNCTACHANLKAIGSKCGGCFVRVHATKRGIWNRLWFQEKLELFSMALSGRVWAIEAGLPPGEADFLVKLFYRGKTTPKQGRKSTKWADRQILAIIESADKIAAKAAKKVSDQ